MIGGHAAAGCAKLRAEGGIMEAYDRLKQLVADCEEDVRKGAGGNKAAQTRARKAMQDIKSVAQDIRAGMLEARNAQPGQS